MVVVWPSPLPGLKETLPETVGASPFLAPRMRRLMPLAAMRPTVMA